MSLLKQIALVLAAYFIGLVAMMVVALAIAVPLIWALEWFATR